MSGDVEGRSVVDKGVVGAKGPLTPLAIIALFLTLSETVVGIVATQTSGGVQVAFAWFAIIFPVAVATAFFVVLWARPWVFYAPTDYAGLDMPRFVDALRGVTDAIQEGTKQLEAERQERMNMLQEQQLRLANRNEFQKLTLEINKLVLQDPSLDVFDHHEKRDPLQVKVESLAYIHMNMFELVYEYYHSSVPLKEAEQREWRTWDQMIHITVANSSALRSLIGMADSEQIYSPGYFNYVKSVSGSVPNQVLHLPGDGVSVEVTSAAPAG